MNSESRVLEKMIGAAGLLVAFFVASADAGETIRACFEATLESDGLKAIKVCETVLSQRGIKGQDRAIVLANRGLGYLKSGNLDRALADFDSSLEINPRYVFAYDNRGDVWRKRGDFARAIGDYTKGLQIDPGFTASYLGRAKAYEAINDMVKARGDYVAARAQTGSRPIDEWGRNEAKKELDRLDSVKK